MKVDGKTLIVTGAGSGIGQALCWQLLEAGANIAGIDIHSEALAETQRAAKVGEDRFKAFVLDITDKARVDALPSEVIKHFGSVDGIINNAGIIQKFIAVNDLTIEEINKVVDVNFYGTVYMTKAFLPLLLERPEAHIVNVSSMGGFIPFPRQTVYGATKAAVKIFTEGLYAELRDTPVHVTVIFPGAVATNITENSGLGPPRQEANPAKGNMALPAAKAAGMIIRAMEKNKFRVTVGKDAWFLDILYRIAPKYATHFIQKKMSGLTQL